MGQITLVLLLSQVLAANGELIRVGPVTTNDRVTFRLHDTTEELALGAIVRLRVDNPAVGYPFQTLVPPRLCSRQGNSRNWNCEASLPAETVKRLNVPGRHDLYSFTFNNYKGESGPSDPWTITTPAPKGKGLK